MTPIQQLLHRIRWDRAFGRGRFELGYFDRATGTIRRVALRDLVFPPDARHAFEVLDESGQWCRIPFHRIRQVWRNGQLIWQRPGRGGT